MKTLTDHLAQYAAYHRDTRNILTHLLGIPLIVLAVAILLSRPAWMLGGFTLSAATLVCLLSALFYLRLDLRFGLLMSVLLMLCAWVGQMVAAQGATVWLVAGVGLFVSGWVIQFVGHYFEGRKPAFVDDLVGLIVGPLFVVAEVAFFLGLRKEVQAAVEERAGPVRAAADKARA